MEPAIIVHGGAWAIPDSLATRSINGVRRAARLGYEMLMSGASAVDVVEATVMNLEDDDVFDAGTGSSLNYNGDVEMDAVIMDGRDLRAGGVACVQNIAHPVALARLLMDKTDHTLLVGKGANEFAAEMNVPKVETDILVTSEAKEELERYRQFGTTVKATMNTKCDTVGAAVLDKQGNVAFATSTGGITGKKPGRVGDSPIIGSGGYADNEVGAVSSTGHGESINKVCLSFYATILMRQGFSPQQAVEDGLRHMYDRVKGCGGLIVVSKDGQLAHHCTTKRMAWASVARGVLHYGLEPDDDIVEDLSNGYVNSVNRNL